MTVRRFMVALLAALGVAAGVATIAANAGAKTGSHHASKHRTHKHKPHVQALSGSLKKAKVRIVAVYIKGGKGGGVDPGDDYPAQWRNAPQDSRLDQWREYNRECTSFVAWALYSRNGFVMPFYDNANGWGPDARRRGYTVDSNPAIGSVAWSNAGSYGHVAYVVAVSGNSVTIEEYNEHYNGTYDKRTVAASAFTGYIHFKDQAAQPAPAPIIQPSSNPVPPPSAQSTFSETVGGPTNTWSNYLGANGDQGQTIQQYQTVQVACKVTGFKVSDGDTWWYQIASSPWNGAYYASADAFYNNRSTSGSLVGTPYVDPAVPNCTGAAPPSPPTSTTATTSAPTPSAGTTTSTPTPVPTPAPAPAPAPSQPQFGVQNASGGIYWRSGPDWNTAEAVAGNGFYPGTVIKVSCYKAGAANVPGSSDGMWEMASWVSGPGSGSGWINEHFINDGSAINQPSPGVPPC